MALVGRSKHKWLKTFLELPHGIPSHDTFGRVFGLINPEEFERTFLAWVAEIQRPTQGGVIAIDGKQLRWSVDRYEGKSAINKVSAWATANELVLVQVKVDEKSNEITAIPKLLELLDISGCLVTIDAIGMQTGQVRNEHYAYEKHGSCTLFAAIEPLIGFRLAQAHRRRTKQVYTLFCQALAAQFSNAIKICLVQDNLNTHDASAFYENLPADEARALADRFEFYFTSKPASWMNMI